MLEAIAQDRASFVENARQSGVTDQTLANDYDNKLFALARSASSCDITSMPWLPQLPDAWAQDIHDEVEQYERMYVSPNLLLAEYVMGRATEPDEIAQIHTNGLENAALLTAEHATSPVRKATGKRSYPDAGTAGLVGSLAGRYGHGLIMVGNQQGNAATDTNHPIKPLISQHLPGSDVFLSVHGMRAGKFYGDHDRTEIQAILGLGVEPSEALHDFASDIARKARDELGLYVGIGNDHYFYEQKVGSTDLRRKNGEVYKARLAAMGKSMTTNYVHDEAARMGQTIPALQVEITNLLRLTPFDAAAKSETSRIIGVALGYKLVEMIIELGFVVE